MLKWSTGRLSHISTALLCALCSWQEKRPNTLTALLHAHTLLTPVPLSWEGSLGTWVGGSSRWTACQEELAWSPQSISGPARRGCFGLALSLSHVWLAESKAWISFPGWVEWELLRFRTGSYLPAHSLTWVDVFDKQKSPMLYKPDECFLSYGQKVLMF